MSVDDSAAPDLVTDAYFGWERAHPAPTKRETWEAGARWMFETTSKLSPHLARLADIGQWVKDEHEHELAVAWAESNANAEEHAIRAMDGELEELPF